MCLQYILIYCNTAARGLTDIYARLPRADISVKPRARPCYNIYVTLPKLSCQMCSARDDIVSKSLIVKKGGAISEKKLADNFCLQLPGWCPCLNCRDFNPQPLQPIQLPTELSSTKDMLRLKRKAPEKLREVSKKSHIEGEDSENAPVTERFQFDCNADELQKFKEGDCPKNTAKNNEWALRNFHAWRVTRNEQHGSDDQCPENVFDDKSKACDWLCKFVCETRRADGQEYTPRSLYLLLNGLQRCIRKSNPTEEVDFFRDAAFKPLKNVCDAVFKRLHAKGVGAEIKATPVMNPDDERKLWTSGVLSLSTPIGLLRAVFFYNGKNFCLRSGQEQRNLKLSQVRRETSILDGKELSLYVYCEFGSKNRQGGLSSFNLQNKVVR